MHADDHARPDPEGRLLGWANAGLEAVVLYLVLAAWARPRDGAAALLPLAACLALPAALAVRRLLDSTTVQDLVRKLAIGLCALAWALAAARLSAPPDYWQADTPRALLLLGAIFGGPVGAGLQPIAFWASVLLWWRGHALGDWLPSIDDAIGRLRLSCVVVGLSVGLAATARRSDEERMLLEQGGGVAVFFVLALLTTGLSRRREMAGGAPAAPTLGDAAHGAPPRQSLAPVLVILVALLALGLAAWGADALSPALLSPIVGVAGQTLELIGTGLTALFQWLAGLWPAPNPAPPAQPTPQPATPAADPTSGWRLDLPAWLSPVLTGLFVIVGGLLIAYVVVMAARMLVVEAGRGINAVSGGDEVEGSARRTESRGPIAILAMLFGIFGTFSRPGRRAGGQTVAAAPATANRPDIGTIRLAYRDFLLWASNRGLARRADETPDEFRRRLIGSCPEAGPEATLLTALYVSARYGDRACPGSDLLRARQALERLKDPAERKGPATANRRRSAGS